MRSMSAQIFVKHKAKRYTHTANVSDKFSPIIP